MAEKIKNGYNVPKVELQIRNIMRVKGVTLDALAKKLGVTSSTMNIKLGGNITLNSLYDIAQVLDCEIADFFPVPKGYRHWTERGEEVRAGGMEFYCPKCGTKFSVGD